MRHTKSVYLARVCLLVTALAVCALAQRRTPGVDHDSNAGFPLEGVIQAQGGLGSGVVVQLGGGGGSMYGMKTYVGANGSFQFDRVPAGQYRLQVLDTYGNVLQEQFVTVEGDSSPIAIRLPQQKVERPVGGTVSVARLQHKVPGKAQKEFDKSEKAIQKKDIQGSIRHLQKAIEIDPEYLEAYNNLGARYMQSHQVDKALQQFEKAVALDAHSALPQSNAAIALLTLSRYADAEKAARRAIDLDPVDMRAKYVLGIALLSLGRETQEALANLKSAARSIPKAHLVAAKALRLLGNQKESKHELDQYLATATPQQRQQAETWVNETEASFRH